MCTYSRVNVSVRSRVTVRARGEFDDVGRMLRSRRRRSLLPHQARRSEVVGRRSELLRAETPGRLAPDGCHRQASPELPGGVSGARRLQGQVRERVDRRHADSARSMVVDRRNTIYR